MKESKNDSILTILEGIDVTKLKDEELNKTAQNIATTININGLRRHINSTLMIVVETEAKDNNQKLELVKKLLNNQKTIEKNVRNFKRKSTIAIDKTDNITFITVTKDILTTIQKYQSKPAIKVTAKTETISTPVANVERKAETLTKVTATQKQSTKKKK